MTAGELMISKVSHEFADPSGPAINHPAVREEGSLNFNSSG